MDIEMVILRALHIVTGVFWAGSAFYLVSYVVPTIRKSWPPSSGLVSSLIGARFGRAIAIAALLSILAGLRMMWRLSAGFGGGFMMSHYGLPLAIGGLCGIAAFVIGAAGIGPSTVRLIKALETAERASEPRDRQLAEARSELGKFTGAVRVASALLGIAVLLMAIAQYV